MLNDLIELSVLAEYFESINLCSKSTLQKLASGNYPKNGCFDDFPQPIKLGSKTFWLLSEIEEWVKLRQEKTAKMLKERLASRVSSTPMLPRPIFHGDPTLVGSGKGRPTRKEKQAAAASGLSVKAWRESNRPQP